MMAEPFTSETNHERICDFMSQFKISRDCLIDKTEDSLHREMLSGDFVIGADKNTPLFDKNSALMLENVFRYNKSGNLMEVYTISPISNREQYHITLDIAFDTTDEKLFETFIQQTLINYDYFFLDKHKNIGVISVQ